MEMITFRCHGSHRGSPRRLTERHKEVAIFSTLAIRKAIRMFSRCLLNDISPYHDRDERRKGARVSIHMMPVQVSHLTHWTVGTARRCHPHASLPADDVRNDQLDSYFGCRRQTTKAEDFMYKVIVGLFYGTKSTPGRGRLLHKSLYKSTISGCHALEPCQYLHSQESLRPWHNSTCC